MVFNCTEDYIPASVRDVLRQIPYFARTEKTGSLVDEIFETIYREYDSPDDYSEDIIRTKVAQLLLTVARDGGEAPREREESPIVEQAGRYIRAHWRENVTLQDVASYCFVSREHLSRIFKKETGFGFNEYLNIYRLKKANAMLLETPKRKIAEVAAQCGFGDSNYFSKQYKKMYGISPKETRKDGV
jgi:YesN/AraC family two-component response regulator